MAAWHCCLAARSVLVQGCSAQLARLHSHPSIQVLGEDSAAVAAFLRLDCSGLKQTLVSECEAWASRFGQQLYSLAGRQLTVLREALAEPAAALAAAGAGGQSDGSGSALGPAELRVLAARLEGTRDELEASVAQCQERFAALATLGVAVLGEEVEAARGLSEAWRGFVATLRALPRRAAELAEQEHEVGGQGSWTLAGAECVPPEKIEPAVAAAAAAANASDDTSDVSEGC